MRISKQGEYGLTAILYLASQPVGKLSLRDEIARRCGIPRGFLAQILARLRKGGILGSRRGAHGGYFLRVEPQRLSLADVLQALEGGLLLQRSVDDLPVEPLNGEAGVRDSREALRRLQERGLELFRSIKIGEFLSAKSAQSSEGFI